MPVVERLYFLDGVVHVRLLTSSFGRSCLFAGLDVNSRLSFSLSSTPIIALERTSCASLARAFRPLFAVSRPFLFNYVNPATRWPLTKFLH